MARTTRVRPGQRRIFQTETPRNRYKRIFQKDPIEEVKEAAEWLREKNKEQRDEADKLQAEQNAAERAAANEQGKA